MKISTAERLNQIMRERNLKQVDILRLAEPYCKKNGIKLHKNDLSQYVNGKVIPGQQKLYILALALNVSEAWLLGFDVPIQRIPTKNQGIDITDIRYAAYQELENSSDDVLEDVIEFIKFKNSQKKDD